MPPRHTELVWILCAGLCAGCLDTPSFSAASLVDRPRILAVVADPPEIAPGADASLHVLVAGAQDYSVTWRACSTFSSFASGSQYGENVGDRGCANAAFELGEGERVTLPTADSAALFYNDKLANAALGSDLGPEALAQIRRSVGLAFSVEADVLADGKRLRAIKRVLVSVNPKPARNPPPPAFSMAARAVRLQASDSFRCLPDGPGALRVQPGQHVRLTPLYEGSDAGEDEPWLETYTVLDGRGVLSTRREQAFYSWFASRGSIDHGKTEAPDRDSAWRAPAEPGCAELWLVVRDGHGGESACGVSVAVGDVEDCAP